VALGGGELRVHRERAGRRVDLEESAQPRVLTSTSFAPSRRQIDVERRRLRVGVDLAGELHGRVSHDSAVEVDFGESILVLALHIREVAQQEVRVPHREHVVLLNARSLEGD
jgi:hypothetical protein